MAVGDGFPDLLARAQAGDEAAMEVLYRDLAPVVTGYLRANGAQEPEDLTSEVFVAVVKGLGQFTGEESRFRSWVLTIAHRRLIDDYRRSSRLRQREAGSLDDRTTEIGGVADSEEEALARLGAGGVLDLLDELTEDQRTVLFLRVLADLPVQEVSEIVGKPVSAVKALQRRSLLRLQKLLKERQ